MRHWLSHRSQQEEMYLTSLAKVTLLYDPQQEEERFSLCLESAQPMKIHCTLNSQFPPMDSLFIPAPRNFPFSSVRVSFPFSLKKKKIFSFCHAIWHVGPQFPDQGSNPFPLHWKLRVLTTGPPRSPSFFFFFKLLTWSCRVFVAAGGMFHSLVPCVGLQLWHVGPLLAALKLLIWEHGILATGPPEKSPLLLFFMGLPVVHQSCMSWIRLPLVLLNKSVWQVK